jgi:hypothetical protein
MKVRKLFYQKQYGFELMLNTSEARAMGQGLRSNPKGSALMRCSGAVI